MPRGAGPGQFSWLTWAGSPSAPTLTTSLLPPGDSYTYVNPDDDTDWLLSAGDWAGGAPGSMNSAAVRARLEVLIGQEIAVPAWSATRGTDNNFDYRVEDFVRVRLLEYQLTGQGWLSFEYLGPAHCDNQPPSVDAGADQTIDLPPGTAALAGSVADDGLPSDVIDVEWEKVTGPGTVTFDDPKAAATGATVSAAGVYVLRLRATDTELEADDEVQITVSAAANEPPVVDAGPDREIALPVDIAQRTGVCARRFQIRPAVSSEELHGNRLLASHPASSTPARSCHPGDIRHQARLAICRHRRIERHGARAESTLRSRIQPLAQGWCD